MCFDFFLRFGVGRRVPYCLHDTIAAVDAARVAEQSSEEDATAESMRSTSTKSLGVIMFCLHERQEVRMGLVQSPVSRSRLIMCVPHVAFLVRKRQPGNTAVVKSCAACACVSLASRQLSNWDGASVIKCAAITAHNFRVRADGTCNSLENIFLCFPSIGACRKNIDCMGSLRDSTDQRLWRYFRARVPRPRRVKVVFEQLGIEHGGTILTCGAQVFQKDMMHEVPFVTQAEEEFTTISEGQEVWKVRF